MDLKGFERRMGVLGNTVGDNAHKLLRKVGLAVDGSVVIATPVDTGRARSNWIVNSGSAATDTREPYSPGKEGSTGGPNAQAAIDQGKATIAAHPKGADLHITNNLAYIGKLNDGSSAQAPPLFVEKAVQAGVNTIRAANITVVGGV